MSGLDLGKQIGPLPLGAWVAVVGTGLGVALYTRRNAAPATDNGGDSTAGGGLTTAGGGVQPEDYVGVGGGGSYTYVPPDGTPGTNPPDPNDGAGVGDAITDNDSWSRAAINYLIASGYNAANAQAAIANAIQGNAMSVSQYALWTVALAHFGAPPYPVDVQPPTSVPGPGTGTTPPPTPTPPKAHWYTIVPGATLGGVSRRFYGTDRRWDDIWRANSVWVHRPDGSKGYLPNDRRNPNLALARYAGHRLYIPA